MSLGRCGRCNAFEVYKSRTEIKRHIRSMDDVDGPVVAKKVYEELFAGDEELFNPNSIPYALDAALQQLRKQNLQPARWAPYVHFGV